MRKLLLVLILAFTVASGFVPAISPTTHVARASSTGYGSQLKFHCSGATYGAVKGYNQRGKFVTWQGYAYGGTYRTTGWYWKGTVTAYWYKDGRWYSKPVWVADWALTPEWWNASC